MKAFRLSGEKSAAVAPAMFKVVPVLVVVSNTITWVAGGGALLPGTGTAFGIGAGKNHFLSVGRDCQHLPGYGLELGTVGGVATVISISPRVPKNEKSVPI